MIFTYVEEGMQEDQSYQARVSSTGIELEEITHVDETTLPDAPASVSGEASQAASISVSMDLASKRMVDDLVDSEETEDGDDAGFSEQPTNRALYGFPYPGHSSLRLKDVGEETSYGLIGSSTAREHYRDCQDPVANPPRPILPSITNSPFALQPGEETPGSRSSRGKGNTPSHSQQNSQTRFPLQRQPIGYSVGSSSSNPSTMPDPTASGSHSTGFSRNQPLLHNAFPSAQNYTMGPWTLAAFGNNPLHAHEPNFLSPEVFEGSTWAGGSDQNSRNAANFMTPPNGQGAG